MTAAIFLLSLSLLSAPEPQRGKEIEELISKGIQLRETQKDSEALDLFRKAYELSQGARALAQLALAEQALGRWVDAETHLKAALDSQQDPWITANRALLDGALRSIQGHLASVEVLSNINGAEVRFNGRSIGNTPMTQASRVAAGSVVIDVTADGYWPVNRVVVASAGATIRETIDLAPRSAPEQKAPSVQVGQAPRAVQAAPAGRSTSPWVYAAGGAALVSVGLGIAGVVVGNSDVNAYNARCQPIPGMDLPPGCNLEASKEAGSGGRTLAAVGFIAAGVLATTAVVLYFAIDDRPAPDSTVNMARDIGSWVGFDGQNILLRGTF